MRPDTSCFGGFPRIPSRLLFSCDSVSVWSAPNSSTASPTGKLVSHVMAVCKCYFLKTLVHRVLNIPNFQVTQPLSRCSTWQNFHVSVSKLLSNCSCSQPALPRSAMCRLGHKNERKQTYRQYLLNILHYTDVTNKQEVCNSVCSCS